MARADIGEAQPVAERSRIRDRISSLDGLRGLAAFVVLIHHAMLGGAPALIYGYGIVPGISAPARWSFDWWIEQTPLHIFWAGSEMVMIFFVLSGYVLTLPAVKRGGKWLDASYYPRRLVRLYVPVWGALALSALLHLIPTHTYVPNGGFWLNGFSAPLSLGDGLKGASILDQGFLEAFTSVIWSMKWEVEFSLILPLVVGLVLFSRTRLWLALLLAVGCFVLIDLCPASQTFSAAPHYLAVFVLGALLAMQISRLPDLAATPAWVGMVLLIATVCLVTTPYMATGKNVTWQSGLPTVISIFGAVCAVWLAAEQPFIRGLLTGRRLAWLGTRSFSLYLVHEPIVASLGFALGGKPNPFVLLACAIPASLLVAEVFWRLVERPAMRLATAAGRAALRLRLAMADRRELVAAP
jgi:peptidoglycan/LPS O-acetylase OafA/YrhL